MEASIGQQSQLHSGQPLVTDSPALQPMWAVAPWRAGLGSPFSVAHWKVWLPPVALLLLAACALPADLPLARWSAGRHHPRLARELLSLAEVLGHGVGVAVVAIMLLTLDGRRRVVIRFILASAWAGLGANIVKLVISRTRPGGFDLARLDVWSSFGGWWPLGHGGSSQQSFPSAHTATAVGMALLLTSLYPRGRRLFAAMAVAVATQRVLGGAHFLSDVLAGAAVGWLMTMLVGGMGRACANLPLALPTPVPERLEVGTPASRRLTRLLVYTALVMLLAFGGYWGVWHYHAKRFQAVRPGVFYRVAQPTEVGMRWLAKYYGIKTVVSVQLYDFRLYRGWFDRGAPDGDRESRCVSELGAQAVQWPMGLEQSWPWLTPWQFEEFFKLLDDPANLPVAVHCQGGRHRTGTLAALFRLEYDRWPADRALDEMYSFQFGSPIRLHEHNLRTYFPRPHPTDEEWTQLTEYWRPILGNDLPDYETLVRHLRLRRTEPALDRAVENCLVDERPFVMPLLARLIDQLDDPLIPRATAYADQCLDRLGGDRATWATSAAIVADFGTPSEQRRLLSRLADEAYQVASPTRFDAVVAGVTNRYTPNRIAFLQPLIENERPQLAPGAAKYRYCDTAVARLSAIIDENLPDKVPAAGIEGWNNGRQMARAWFITHPNEAQPRRLVPPTGNNKVLPGEPPTHVTDRGTAGW
jgi:membrane-associated phospholipid phosphatase